MTRHQKWISEWQIKRETKEEAKNKITDHDGAYDAEGWQYSIDWTKRFYGAPFMSAFVRRRRWVRIFVEEVQVKSKISK